MKILISQQAPSKMTAYANLIEKFGAQIDFRPFFLIEPLDAKEFRLQKIHPLDFTAVVFSSRHAIDAYFRICEELRLKVPETMKYFCTTELVAMYLQKHIVYRKRKIFFGDGTPQSIISQIGTKHREEKFLITTSDNSSSEVITGLFDKAGLQYTTAIMVKSVTQDLKDLDLSAYDVAVMYNPYDVQSLTENFPDFKQGDLKIVAFGKSIVKAMTEAGLEISIQGPTPEAPSAAKAIEILLSQN